MQFLISFQPRRWRQYSIAQFLACAHLIYAEPVVLTPPDDYEEGFLTPPDKRICAILYEHPDYNGQSLIFHDGDRFSDFSYASTNLGVRKFNDNASSLKVTATCTLSLYEHASFEGAKSQFRGNLNATDHIANFADYRINDYFSSGFCSCQKPLEDLFEFDIY